MARKVSAGAALIAAAFVAVQDWAQLRGRMIKDQIEARGVTNPAVLRAMRQVPRHLFVPEPIRGSAYEDRPLPIGYRQTISQPFMVASMTEMLDVRPHHVVLEIGTGCGYQTAILAKLARTVYSMEIVEPLAKDAAARLQQMGYDNVYIQHGDGYPGWPEKAPFDRIIVTAAPPEIPQALVEQLRSGGRLVVPVGKDAQDLVVLEKDANGRIHKETKFPVLFVPMVPGKD